jgi:hypothetical protein
MNRTVVPDGLRTPNEISPFACIAIVLLAAIAIPAAAEAQPDLDGVYASRGTNSDGSEYRGAVHILRHGDRFVVSWMTLRAAGEGFLLELTAIGVGLRTGDTLAVSYVAGSSLGVIVYQIGEDGHLAGRWTTAGDDAVHSETLTRLPGQVPNDPAAADPPDAPTTPRRRAPRPSAGTISL